jgi:hypothetical protein
MLVIATRPLTNFRIEPSAGRSCALASGRISDFLNGVMIFLQVLSRPFNSDAAILKNHVATNHAIGCVLGGAEGDLMVRRS